MDDIISVRDLNLYYGEKHALHNINMDIKKNTITALIGPSGCGKSTFLKCLNRMNDLIDYVNIEGTIKLNGKDIYSPDLDVTKLRKEVGMVFQQPNPFPMSIYDNIAYGPRVHGIKNRKVLDEIVETSLKQAYIFEEVKDILHKSALSLSGGQQQRICIARAIALNPDFIVCDEPVSALDVSIQAQIINLLNDLQDRYGLTYLFISHDLSVVEHISDTVGVMYLGNLVEYADKEEIFKNPLHPYTKALFSAIPIPDPDAKINRIILEGSIPSPANPPKGCKFHTRCAQCMEICETEAPEARDVGGGHMVSCHLYDNK